MLNCGPRVKATTADYLINQASILDDFAWNKFLDTPIYVHWQTLYKKIKDIPMTRFHTGPRRIIEGWEENKILPIPNSENSDELPSLVQLNERYTDNVYVFCRTFGEYINLRKNFGRDDIGGYSLDAD